MWVTFMGDFMKDHNTIQLQISLVELFAVAFSSSTILVLWKIPQFESLMTKLGRWLAHHVELSEASLFNTYKQCVPDCELIPRVFFDSNSKLRWIVELNESQWISIAKFFLIEISPIVFASVVGAAVWSLVYKGRVTYIFNLFDKLLYILTSVVAFAFVVLFVFLLTVLNGFLEITQSVWPPIILGIMISGGLLAGIWENSPIGEHFTRHSNGKKLPKKKKVARL